MISDVFVNLYVAVSGKLTEIPRRINFNFNYFMYLCFKIFGMVGRVEELKMMQELLYSENPHILMLTGRRRVGKTYLIEQAYMKDIIFSFTGTEHADMINQLGKFYNRLNFFTKNKKEWLAKFNWAEAFNDLTKFIQKKALADKRRVIFFDEFPWINSDKSGFLEEFAYWWNEYASKMNVLVVISGSATTWMIKKIINNKSGLHNRVTRRIHLLPFTLHETKIFLRRINPRLSEYDICQLYMCMGGVPLYLDQIKAGESVNQSIDRICFKKNGLLNSEFNSLYAALYDKHENHIAVVRALAGKWQGLTREELVAKTKLSDGGGFTSILEELESCNFIISHKPMLNKKRGTIYLLADEYSRFYLRFIENGEIKNFQTYAASSRIFTAWQGHAFEVICIKHIQSIKIALQIGGIDSSVYSYYQKGIKKSSGFQIDALIDRADNVINLCEMKFYNKEVILSAKFINELRQKRARFIELSKTKKTVYNTLISTFGTDKSLGTISEIDSEVTLKHLFNLQRFEQ